MLQRAASNAYSWWWASHIRTKQSKWLEQNLQDMEEKVGTALKILHEEGDSFVRRAEMYYRQRPELIQFVEESYRAYRSLAERYDHISTELQKANNTIASCFPDQVPFMDDDDDDASPRPQRKMPEGAKANVPKVPKPPESSPLRDLKSVIRTATKKFSTKKTAAPAPTPKVTSGLSKQEVRKEIDKLQKQILALQTVKEFVKSSYDSSLAKYWETEEQIKQLQDKISSLGDEIGEGIVIEDDEARHLMAEAALKSCQETLAQLQLKQEKSVSETKIESKKVKETRKKLESLMDEFNSDQSYQRQPRVKRDVKEKKELDEDVDRMSDQTQEFQSLHEKIKVQFETGTSLSVTEMAEKINELVNKVIGLETSVSSHTGLVNRLRTETDDLQSQIRTLEGDKASLINDKINLNNKLREMEEKLQGVQNLNHIVEDQNTNLRTHFTEACCNLHHLSDKVQDVKPDEKVEIKDLSQTERRSTGEAESEYGFEEQDALNKDRGIKLPNDENRATDFVEGEVNSNTGLQLTGLVEGDVKSDKELQVTGSPESGVKLGNELKIATSLEKDEASPVRIKSPKELNEQEKILIPVNNDKQAKEVVTMSNTAGFRNVSQPQATGESDNFSESSGNRKGNSAMQISSEVENTLIPVTSDKQEGESVTVGSTAGYQNVRQPQATSGVDDFSDSSGNQKGNSAMQISSEVENTLIPVTSDKQEGESVTVGNTAGYQNVRQPQATSGADDFSGSSGNQKGNSTMQISSEVENTLIPGTSDKQAKESVSVGNTAGYQNVSQPQATSRSDNFSDSSGDQKANSAMQISSEVENTLIPVTSDKQAKESVTVSNTAGYPNVSQPHATSESDNFSESSGNQKGNSTMPISSEMENTLKVDSQQHVAAQEDEPDWRQLFMNGIQDREKALLTEYTNTLRSYKDMKKQLTELEKKNQDTLFDTSLLLKELKTENAMKNEEIKLLRHKLSLLQRSLEGDEDLKEVRGSAPSPDNEGNIEEPEKEDNIMAMLKAHQPATVSATEERFRANIDAILEENLDFWLQFSTTFTEIQKFESTITDMQSEVSKLEEKRKASEGSSSIKYTAKSDARPIYKHLMEIHTELTVWLEKSVQLKDELQNRFSSLCDIQEEITKALKDSAEDDDFQFTSYQAAKFQGEVLNMKHENNKVADELQAGLDHMTNLQIDVEKALGKLNEQFGLSSSKRQQNGQLARSGSKSNSVPLRSFIFGVKPKKQKQSIFSCMTPAMHRKYRALKG